MKKIIHLFFIIPGLFPLLLAGQSGPPEAPPVAQPPASEPVAAIDTTSAPPVAAVDSLLESTIGARQLDLILHAESIEAHQVSQFVAENEGPFQLEGFPMLASTELTAAQGNNLLRTLGTSESYLFSEGQKLCYFLPEMGFVFNRGEDHLTVLISTQCDLLRLYSDDNDGNREFTTLNVDPAHSQLQAIYAELFPTLPEVPPAQRMESLTMQLVSEPVHYKVLSGEGWSHIALKASHRFGKKVSIRQICKLNNVEYGKAMQNKVYPLIGERVIIGLK